jgi:dUTP pyrophosphatase
VVYKIEKETKDYLKEVNFMAEEVKRKRASKNDSLVVKVKVLDPKASIPAYQTKGAACFDIATIEDVFLANTKAYVTLPFVRTGLAFDIPEGYHMELYIRSSIGRNTKIRLANQVGIIDSDYKDNQPRSQSPYHRA